MPEGPVGAPRLTNIGPLSRATKEEIKHNWKECPASDKENKICKEIKRASLAILENQGIFAECEDLIDINSGNCYDIAEQVMDNVENDNIKVITVGDRDHAWIKYDNKHYDAEAPTGVSNYKDLPFFERTPEYMMLRLAKQAAEAEEREPPQSLEDTIEDVTDEYR